MKLCNPPAGLQRWGHGRLSSPSTNWSLQLALNPMKKLHLSGRRLNTLCHMRRVATCGGRSATQKIVYVSLSLTAPAYYTYIPDEVLLWWPPCNSLSHCQCVFPHATSGRCSQFRCGLEPNPRLSNWSCGCCCKCSWLNSAKTYLFLVQICCALSEYSTGTFKEVKFVSQYAAEYQEIMMRLRKLQVEMKGKYHNMKKHLTDCVM